MLVLVLVLVLVLDCQFSQTDYTPDFVEVSHLIGSVVCRDRQTAPASNL